MPKKRKNIRLRGFDYSSEGLYFITICCQDRACLFGDIENGEMILNDAGKMVKSGWFKIQERYKNIQLHEYVVMPNHFHAILEIVGAPLVGVRNENNATGKGQPQGIAPTGKTVGDMVGAFQSIVTVEYIRGVKTLGWKPFDGKLWQRNYYEHIIRNDTSFQRIRNYIVNNPGNWHDDKFFK